MKKNLFLTCALALFAVVGVSAQNWCRTLATGLPGTEITHDVNGTSVTQYRAETALIQNAGAKGVRYTVVQTTATGAFGGGPFFAMGEMIVLNAAGDTIQYTVTSNADHNSGGAGTDGAGLPALNDGNFNNYFHSSWGGNEPGGLHYLELTFAETVDAYQLIWYTRPNQHVNRPQIVGLTNLGVEFTEDMLFAEYEFELGDRVTDESELAAGGAFTLFADAEEDLSAYGDYTSNGSTFINLSGYTTGQSTTAGPQHIVQFIPTENGTYILYQPVGATYYCDPNRWQDGYNGKNGWLRAYAGAQYLDEFEIERRADGDFEITTEIYRQWVDGAWVNYDEPIKVWVGYDPRGNLKIFPENVKEGLEQGDYTLGFGLPVDFGFTINKAHVNEELVPSKTSVEMCAEVLASTLKTIEEKKEAYAEWLDYDYDGAAESLDEAVEEAQEIVETGDLAAAFDAKDNLTELLAAFVAIKAYYYEEVLAELEDAVGDYVQPPYSQADTGKYTYESYMAWSNAGDAVGEIMAGDMTYSAIESAYARIEGLLEQIEATRLSFSEFPEIVSDIADNNFPYSELPNNAVWEKSVNLVNKVKGIRLTFLDRHIGSAADGGNFPMIALGEFKLYDVNGNEVTLTAENFYANHTETSEGFESTVARLCDGNFGAQGYYHSPWSGNEPQEYIYLDVTFPEAMDAFKFEVYSRDKSTSKNQVSLFPKKVAITTVGEGYDPLLFTENPYNVFVGEKVTSVDQITGDGLYVIRGLLNTQPVLAYNEDSTAIVTKDPSGTAMFYHGTDRYHASSAAVRAAGVYRFVPNTDGTFKALSLGLAKYWPSTEETGYVDNQSTYEAEKAANLNIVASTNVADAFVMYETIEGLTTEDSIDTDADGVKDELKVYQTPYVVFMDWANRLATRPVTDPQPFRDEDGEIRDAQGDALCFNKANGEGEWEIYKVTMDNPDFYWLTNMTGAFDALGLKVGTNPGEVSELGNLEAVLADALQVVADSAYADAPAAAQALAKEIAAVTKLEKNPMVEGVYQVLSAVAFNDGATKALHATVTEDGTPTFGWKSLVEGDIQFYFHFTKSENAEDLVAGGTVAEEDGDKVYNIRAIATYEGETPYYVGEADGKSVQIDLFADAASDYVVLNATGSSFNLSLAGKHSAGFSLHANGHGDGAGTGSNIVYWDGSAGASQWFLKRVDYETSINDLVTEGTEVVSVAYYTAAGAAVPAPVQGINIIVTTYANGVVETKKVLVK